MQVNDCQFKVQEVIAFHFLHTTYRFVSYTAMLYVILVHV